MKDLVGLSREILVARKTRVAKRGELDKKINALNKQKDALERARNKIDVDCTYELAMLRARAEYELECRMPTTRWCCGCEGLSDDQVEWVSYAYSYSRADPFDDGHEILIRPLCAACRQKRADANKLDLPVNRTFDQKESAWELAGDFCELYFERDSSKHWRLDIKEVYPTLGYLLSKFGVEGVDPRLAKELNKADTACFVRRPTTTATEG